MFNHGGVSRDQWRLFYSNYGGSRFWNFCQPDESFYDTEEYLLEYKRNSEVSKQCKKISNDKEPIQSDPTSCPQNQNTT